MQQRKNTKLFENIWWRSNSYITINVFITRATGVGYLYCIKTFADKGEVVFGVEELRGREGDLSGDSYCSARTTGQRGVNENSKKTVL